MIHGIVAMVAAGAMADPMADVMMGEEEEQNSSMSPEQLEELLKAMEQHRISEPDGDDDFDFHGEGEPSMEHSPLMLDRDMPESDVGPVEYQYEKLRPVSTSFVTCKEDILCETFQSEQPWSSLADAAYNGDTQIALKDGDWLQGDYRLILKDGMKFHGAATQLKTQWSPSDGKPLTFSMDVQFSEEHNCGGGYAKLYFDEEGAENLNGKHAYSIMFGPDKCGGDTRKVHFIGQYTSPTGERIEEHLEKKIDLPIDMRKTHQYGFVLQPNGILKIYIDNKLVREGDLKTLTVPGWESPDMIPDPQDPVPEGWVPEHKMIPDLSATKPDDWDETEPEMIEDISAQMPENWLEDEPLLVPNMDAAKPEDWDDEADGEWIRPMKKNPQCYDHGCGPWSRPVVPNPAYKGPWSPPLVPNPNYTEHYQRRQIKNPNPYKIDDPFQAIEPINAVGFEIWTVQGDTAIDNVHIGYSEERLGKWVSETFNQRLSLENDNFARRHKGSQTPGTESTDPNRYVKLGAGILILTVLLIIAVRRLFATFFPSKLKSDAAHKKNDDQKDTTDKDATTTEKDQPNTDKAQTATDKDQTANSEVTAANKSTTEKEAETEQAVPEQAAENNEEAETIEKATPTDENGPTESSVTKRA